MNDNDTEKELVKYQRLVNGRVLIGYSHIGIDRAALVADLNASEASFNFSPDSKLHPDEVVKSPRIMIGLNQPCARDVYECLLHEAVEWGLLRRGARFERTETYTLAHDRYWFLCNHADFAEAIAQAAGFISDMLPEVLRLYRSNQRRKKQHDNKTDRHINRRPRAGKPRPRSNRKKVHKG